MIYKDNFLSYIDIKAENTAHYIIRCPYCGDSAKHQNKGHLYINKEMPVFYCVRCGVGGHIIQLIKKLSNKDIPIDEVVDIDEVKKHEYNTSIKKKSIIANKDIRYKIEISDKDQNKIDYLSKRIIKFKIDDINRYNIITNIFNFIEKNKIPIPLLIKNSLYNRKEYFNDVVSFLTFFKCKLVCRYIGDIKKYYRYINVPLIENSPDKYIIIENEFPNNIPKICVAEGVFDIINLNKLFGKKYDFYIAGLNRNYFNAIIFLSQMLQIPIMNVDVYIDQDITKDYIYSHVICRTKNICKKVRIFKNKIGKDFGEKEIEIVKVSSIINF